MRILFRRRRLQGFLPVYPWIEMRIEVAVCQVQRFHQRLQASGSDAVAAKAHGGFLDDAVVHLGIMF